MEFVQNKGKLTFNHNAVVNIYILHERNLWPFKYNSDFTLGNSFFRAVKLTKNDDFDKHKYSGYGIGFDMHGRFSLSIRSGFDKNIIIFGADMSLSPHIDNKKKDIFILGKGPTHGLDDATLTPENQNAISFAEQQKRFCSSLHFNGANSYLFVNGVEICKFKDFDRKATP